jgi:hypothetical protein
MKGGRTKMKAFAKFGVSRIFHVMNAKGVSQTFRQHVDIFGQNRGVRFGMALGMIQT